MSFIKSTDSRAVLIDKASVLFAVFGGLVEKHLILDIPEFEHREVSMEEYKSNVVSVTKGKKKAEVLELIKQLVGEIEQKVELLHGRTGILTIIAIDGYDSIL